MKLRNLTVSMSIFAFAGSVLAMENQERALVNPNSFVKGYSQALSLAGSLSREAKETIDQAMVTYFDLNDPEICKWAQERKEDLACIVKVAECQQKLCEGLEGANATIQTCNARQQEILSERDKVGEELEGTQKALTTCNDTYREQMSAIDDKLFAAGANCCVCLMKVKTAIFKNRACRFVFSAGRGLAPVICGSNLVLSTVQTCAEGALTCVINVIPSYVFWGKVVLIPTSFGVFYGLNWAAQDVAELIEQQRKCESAHTEQEGKLKKALEDLQARETGLKEEQKAKLEAAQTAEAERQQLDAEKSKIQKQVADAMAKRALEMRDDCIEGLRDDMGQANQSDYVCRNARKNLRHVLDSTLLGLAAKVNVGNETLLLTGAPEGNKPNDNNRIEDVTK